ncbi:helix-turn-helix transcriptional regulator [Azotosporobacter soli]|uniref:helix-turn-helix domain-containing protein n=1 Tax=Azotosporobacter soli TaxID=3055040 RepID=UPI0031FF1E26
MNFSSRLKELRIQADASQKDLAALVGISPRSFRYYESGEKEPNIATLITLADYFKVSLDYLVGRSDTK